MEGPSKIWWIAHVFLWVVSGLACYVLWKEKNLEAARKHLIHSLWIGIVVPTIIGVTLVALMAALGVPVENEMLSF